MRAPLAQPAVTVAELLLEPDRRGEQSAPRGGPGYLRERLGRLLEPARRRRVGALSLLEQVCNGSETALVFGARPYSSKAVAACLADAWTLGLVNRETGEECFAPFRCRSWRCTRCAPGVNARDAARVAAGLGARDPRDLLFLTLTFDPAPIRAVVAAQDARAGIERPAHELEARARALAWLLTRASWKRLRDRLAYRLGQGTGRARRRAPLPYVQTWEGHRSGWPHVHAVVCSADLARDVASLGHYQAKDARTGEPRAIWRWAKAVLAPLCEAVGFGRVVDVQFPRSWQAVGQYLVKLAQELTGSTIKGQTPTAAPRNFRRLRSTPRLLPPARVRGEEFTGALLRAPVALLVEALDSGAETWKDAETRVLHALERLPALDRGPPSRLCASDP